MYPPPYGLISFTFSFYRMRRGIVSDCHQFYDMSLLTTCDSSAYFTIFTAKQNSVVLYFTDGWY